MIDFLILTYLLQI